MKYEKSKNTEKLYNTTEEGLSSLAFFIRRPDFGQGVSVCYIGFTLSCPYPLQKKNGAVRRVVGASLLDLTEFQKKKNNLVLTQTPSGMLKDKKSTNARLAVAASAVQGRLGVREITRTNISEIFLPLFKITIELLKVFLVPERYILLQGTRVSG